MLMRMKKQQEIYHLFVQQNKFLKENMKVIFLKLLSIYFLQILLDSFFLITFFTIISIYLHLTLDSELHIRNYIYYTKLRIMNFFLTFSMHVRVSLLSRCISFGLGQSLSQVTNLLKFLVPKAFIISLKLCISVTIIFIMPHTLYIIHMIEVHNTTIC